MLSEFQYNNAIYSSKFNLLYFPVPKNASSTIHYWFLMNHELEDSFNNRTDTKNIDTHRFCNMHLGLKSQVTYKYVSKFIEDRKPFTFAVVRNPWKRLVSCYVHKFVRPRTLETFAHDINAVLCSDDNERITFNQLIDYAASTGDEALNTHLRPQDAFVPEIVGDGIIRLGKISTLAETLTKKYSFPASAKIKRNQTKSKVTYDLSGCAGEVDAEVLKRPLFNFMDYKKFYTPDSAKKVLLRYAKDVERFGYMF